MYTFRVEDSGQQLSKSEHHLVAENVQALQGLQLASITTEAKLGSTADRMKIYRNGEMLSRMHRRTLIAVKADGFAHLDRKKLRKNPAQKQGAAPRENDIPPLDGLTLQAIIDQFYRERRYEKPIETQLQGDIAEAFPGFFGGEESFADFLAAQETLVDCLAQQEQQPGES